MPKFPSIQVRPTKKEKTLTTRPDQITAATTNDQRPRILRITHHHATRTRPYFLIFVFCIFVYFLIPVSGSSPYYRKTESFYFRFLPSFSFLDVLACFCFFIFIFLIFLIFRFDQKFPHISFPTVLNYHGEEI